MYSRIHRHSSSEPPCPALPPPRPSRPPPLLVAPRLSPATVTRSASRRLGALVVATPATAAPDPEDVTWTRSRAPDGHRGPARRRVRGGRRSRPTSRSAAHARSRKVGTPATVVDPEVRRVVADFTASGGWKATLSTGRLRRDQRRRGLRGDVQAGCREHLRRDAERQHWNFFTNLQSAGYGFELEEGAAAGRRTSVLRAPRRPPSRRPASTTPSGRHVVPRRRSTTATRSAPPRRRPRRLGRRGAAPYRPPPSLALPSAPTPTARATRRAGSRATSRRLASPAAPGERAGRLPARGRRRDSPRMSSPRSSAPCRRRPTTPSWTSRTSPPASRRSTTSTTRRDSRSP